MYLMTQVYNRGVGIDAMDCPLHHPHVGIVLAEVRCEGDNGPGQSGPGQEKITLSSDITINSAASTMVNWNIIFSTPRRVRKVV